MEILERCLSQSLSHGLPSSWSEGRTGHSDIRYSSTRGTSDNNNNIYLLAFPRVDGIADYNIDYLKVKGKKGNNIYYCK